MFVRCTDGTVIEATELHYIAGKMHMVEGLFQATYAMKGFRLSFIWRALYFPRHPPK